ncbi:unnamed protein product [Symbiodinium pilosum]|uniref:Uncharacterized protein n=1 Tax=Symbiodinium pilosum TaxID=2952 RepID=A0A812Y8U7_SYMPI|nr:unnamed protein product [Symbiodinium pilosum]
MLKPSSAAGAESSEEILRADPEPAFSHHDLLCKEIYAKSSKGLERLGRFLENRKVWDKERADWSRNRYRHQIESAQLWADLHNCANQLKAPPLELPPLDPDAYNPWEVEPDMQAPPSGQVFGAPARHTAVRRAHGLFSPYASMSDLAAAFHAPEDGGRRSVQRNKSDPELSPLRPTPGRRPRGLMKGGPKQEIVWPGGWIPKQSVGSRGLPPGFITAKAFPSGQVMYPKDRWFPPDKAAPSGL